MYSLLKQVLDPKENARAFRDLILLLTRYRSLTFEMARLFQTITRRRFTAIPAAFGNLVS